MLEPQSTDVLWILVVGFIVSFFLAFGVGANDVANSFGTSVGAKVLTLKQACILATIFEILGAILIGYKVSDTVRKDIADTDAYQDSEKELMLGNLAALSGSAVWNILATFFKLPISGTHSIVGAVVGFTLVGRGASSIHWGALGKIVASWFLSPVLSGMISVGIFVIIRQFILKKENPLEPGLRSLPFFYGFTLFVNVFSIVHDGSELLRFDRVPWWGVTILSTGIAAIAGLVVWFILVPRLRTKIMAQMTGNTQGELYTTIPMEDMAPHLDHCMVMTESVQNGTTANSPTADNLDGKSNGVTDMNGKASNGQYEPLASTPPSAEVANGSPAQGKPMIPEDKSQNKELDVPEVAQLFSFLQILTAIFGSFAHGGNDVSNAIGPLMTLWVIYQEGSVEQLEPAPPYILLYGGVGISVGLWIWGRRVIQTLGEDLTKLTPSSGFTIEIGAALTVLVASKAGLPISTTHCKVGSVVFVGWVRSRQAVDWRLFRNIVMAWVLTLPVTGGLSAAIMAIFFAAS